jgi:predicted kinase
MYLAAVLHDVAKPETTRIEDGRIRHPGHARRGAHMVRELLWRAGLEWQDRELVCACVAYHLKPSFLLEFDDPARQARSMAEEVPLSWLAMLARADVNGRVCADACELHERIALFEVAAREADCWEGPYPFANDTSRFEYFDREDRDPAWSAFEKPELAEVALLSGLPGSGKDTWAAAHSGGREVVSLDDIRGELGISPRGNQGAVAAAATARMRVLLRRGDSFVFNATNLTKRTRAKSIRLATQYGARVQIVCVEAEFETLMGRNRDRGGQAVPERVMAKMVSQWEFPSTTECHARTICT